MKVTFYNVYFMEDDIVDGDFPRDDTRTDVYTGLTVEEAAGLISREGLTFAATGADWAADPDGSRIVNYATGRRVEVSAHVEGANKHEERRLVELVG